jgi:Rap1a immunity proteins
MKPTPLLLAMVGCLLISAGSPASEGRAMTAADLQQLCRGSDTTSKNVCRIYILGVVQGIVVGLNIADGKGMGARPCIPNKFSAEVLEEAVKSSLAEDLTRVPTDRNVYASGIIGGIMAKVFPCPKPGH